MKQALMTLAMIGCVSVPTRAEDTLGRRVDAVTESARGALESAKQRAREQAGWVADSASESAEQVAKAASERADQAKAAAREKADDAAGYGSELSDQVGALARDQADKLGAHVSGLVARGKQAASAALATARGEARDLLMGAADALDRQNAEAKKAARRAHWDEVRTRFKLGGERPSAELSEELRDHEYRVARLTRVRALADDAEDTAAITRADRLLEVEHGRHRRRVLALRAEQRAVDGDDP